jgi:hypothetical protein
MSAFDRAAEDRHDLDFRLMVNSSVVLFWRPVLLERNLDWLARHGYDVNRVDASGWRAEHDLHHDLAAALEFPDYYGENLDALNDCLRSIAGYDYRSSPEATGFVLALTGYDAFAEHCPDAAHAVLDIFAVQSRFAGLIGHRMLCLIQSDDPDIDFEPVGRTPVMWNNDEWLDSNRHPV